MEDIWPEIAKNVLEFFSNNENKKILAKLVNLLDVEFYKQKQIEDTNNPFYWKKVCITWSFWEIKRDYLIKSLEEVWWKFVNSVSKNTDYLLAWEKAWSKLEKAKNLGIEVLDLNKFREKIKK